MRKILREQRRSLCESEGREGGRVPDKSAWQERAVPLRW